MLSGLVDQCSGTSPVLGFLPLCAHRVAEAWRSSGGGSTWPYRWVGNIGPPTESLISTRNHPLFLFGNAVLIVLFFGFILISVVGILYAPKTALGIDVVPGVDMLPDESIQRLFQ